MRVYKINHWSKKDKGFHFIRIYFENATQDWCMEFVLLGLGLEFYFKKKYI